jgi:hypothetical protein
MLRALQKAGAGGAGTLIPVHCPHGREMGGGELRYGPVEVKYIEIEDLCG